MNLKDFKGKNVLIMGLGLHGGGVGSAEFFARLGARVLVTDLKPSSELRPSFEKLRRYKNISYHLGAHKAGDFKKADYVIQNPGVSDSSPFLRIAGRAGVPILSDVEIFFLVCPASIIGITGTKGKSTTTWLIGSFLKAGEKIKRLKNIKRRVWVGGNIRTSMLDFLLRVRAHDFVVLELSSFQLESLRRIRRSPKIAVITNIFPDHLNRYSSMRSYREAKVNVFRFQKSGDLLFLPSRGVGLKGVRNIRSRIIRIQPGSVFRKFANAFRVSPPEYHQANVALAIAVAKHFGVGDSAIRSVLKNFSGLPGRMELVRKVRGIEFINDTTATNPVASLEAIRATKRRIGRHSLHVIAGGHDKGLPLAGYVASLVEYASSVVFLPGTATKKMESRIKNLESRKRPRVSHAKTMSEAVGIAYRNTESGDVVLLSTGAASFGLFRHEFDRGDQFTASVKRLKA